MLQTLANLAQVIGGVGVHVWARLQPWAQALRDEQNQPLLLEWCQWLAEHMERRGRPLEAPAYVRHRGWSGPS